ncbi:MAG TPA: hypothetical protein VNO30_07335 [Kofleriaceae bacterium]|nr:hypothetical protein [Kofleriaceae bacterium]
MLPGNWTAEDLTAELSSHGGVILERGLHYIQSPIYLPSGTTLEGLGYSTHIACTGDFPAFITREGAGGPRSERVTVQNLRVRRNNTSGAGTPQTQSIGIRWWGNDLRFEDLWLEDHFCSTQGEDVGLGGAADYVSPTAPTACGPNALTDSTRSWAPNEHAGRWVYSGNASMFLITGNNATTLYLDAGGATPESFPYTIFLGVAELDPSYDVKLINVRSRHVAGFSLYGSQWGFEVNSVRGYVQRDCQHTGSRLDGTKLRRNTQDVLIDGGRYYGCRQAGINLFGGGYRVKLRGGVCDGNGIAGVPASGIEIKTSWLNPCFGNVAEIEIDGWTCRDNAGSGLVINRDADAPVTRSLVQHVSIRGGVMEANRCGWDDGSASGAGMYLRGRDITVEGTRLIRNLGVGLWATSDARDVTLANIACIANGAHAAGGGSNLVIDGQRIKVAHLTSHGKESTDVSDDAEFDALPVVTANAVLVQSTARAVTIWIRDADVRGHSLTIPINTVAGAELIAHYEGAGAPYRFGGIGSTFQRTDGGTGTSLYVKESGTAVTPTGWTGK